MKTASTKPKTEVTVISRNVIKRTGAVVYLCKPSEAGKDPYATTVIKGKATGCTCDGNAEWHKVCKHMKHCQAQEQSRPDYQQTRQQHLDEDREYRAAKVQERMAEHIASAKADIEYKWYQKTYPEAPRAMMSREAYTSMYDPCNVA